MTAVKDGNVRRYVFGVLYTALMAGGALFLVLNDRHGWWDVLEGVSPLLFLGWAFACMLAMFLLWWLCDLLRARRASAAGGEGGDAGRETEIKKPQ